MLSVGSTSLPYHVWQFATVGGYSSCYPEAYVAANYACGSSCSICNQQVCTVVCANFVSCYPEGCAAASHVQCQCNARGSLSKLAGLPPRRKINVTSKSPVGDISVVTLIRTDTTLDHSQKAEKVWQAFAARSCQGRFPQRSADSSGWRGAPPRTAHARPYHICC